MYFDIFGKGVCPMESMTLEVEGMSCGHCKSSVEDALKGLDGITRAQVNLDTGEVEVTYDKTKVKVSDMREAVEEQGYDVVS